MLAIPSCSMAAYVLHGDRYFTEKNMREMKGSRNVSMKWRLSVGRWMILISQWSGISEKSLLADVHKLPSQEHPTSRFNNDTLSHHENTLIAHILCFFLSFFSSCTVHLREMHPFAFTGTSSLARCH